MKYLYWLVVVAVVVLGIYISMTFSVGPQTTNIIKFTHVTYPEEFGTQVAEFLKDELKNAQIVMAGTAPGSIEDMELIRGVIEADKQIGKFDLIIVEPNLPYVELFGVGVYINIKEDMPRLVEGIQTAVKQGMKVLIVGPNIYSSQLLPGNPVDKLKNEYHMDVLSLSIAKFPLTKDQEKTLDPKCIDSGEVDPAGTSNFGCVVRNMARRTYRKKFEPNKYSGVMDKVGDKDYVIIFNRN